MKYVAKISGVREVVAVGTCDLAFWTDTLRPLRLVPDDVGGHAQMQIGAFRSRWKGIAFGECIVTVAARPADSEREGAYLVQGYNTNRFFAFVERARFKTPYRCARLAVDVATPIAFDLDGGELHRLNGRMSPHREPMETKQVSFEGPAFLPTGRVFQAYLKGTRRVFGVEPTDEFAFNVSSGPLACIAQSGFVPQAWEVGDASSHARSKTMRRPN